MARLAPWPKLGRELVAATLQLDRTTASPPLYREVSSAIERLALTTRLGDERALPTETGLMEQFAVRRGTFWKTTEELAREGILRIEPGKGTFVDQAKKIRLLVWEKLLKVAKPDSRFDLDLSRFVPDFTEREKCDEQLCELPGYRGSQTIFIAPDNSLEAFRVQALKDGKSIIVPTYGMRRGFVLLEGMRISSHDRLLAATLDGMERFGRYTTLNDLRNIESVGLVVTGAVAVTKLGLHFGAGDGYFDLEWALLRHCELVTSKTPIAVSVHDCQVIDAQIRPAAHDAVVDIIVTPTKTRICTPSLPKPDGILWNEIRVGSWSSSPYVDELVREKQSRRFSNK